MLEALKARGSGSLGRRPGLAVFKTANSPGLSGYCYRRTSARTLKPTNKS